jgi:rhodanese-related sulfurtransferase
MKRLALSLATALTFAVPSVALACEKHQEQNAAKPTVKKVTVAELNSLQKEKKVSPVDANGAQTRAKMGVIPGAILLTSSSQYDAAKELPKAKDQKLVFYCANTMCTASEKAAERAIEAGYTDVSILPEGIKGWKEAGQKTELPRS